jgi:uncharacterized protein (TIGR02217 family)
MAFHEIQFPTDISAGSSGGPERITDIVTLRSGFEERNSIWANSRRRYDASQGIRSIDKLYETIEFFEARRGRLHGFRWRDWSDYRSGKPKKVPAFNDQQIGTGNGVATQFQLSKTYSLSSNPWTREIKKPVAGTVLIGKNGVQQTITTHFTVDTTTGIVTFVTPPANGHVITAGFEFDVPVRFDTDFMNVSVEIFEAGSLPQIDILEIRV